MGSQGIDGVGVENEGAAEAGPDDGPLAAALARGVSRTLRALGGETLTEFTLRTGRRVDVIAVGEDGRVTIVEIKTSLADFRSDGKWQDYLDFCDFFYFAVPENFPREVLPADCGLMVADGYEALILMPARDRPVNAARHLFYCLMRLLHILIRIAGLLFLIF